jgi:hypothetical protein
MEFRSDCFPPGSTKAAAGFANTIESSVPLPLLKPSMGDLIRRIAVRQILH